MNRFGELNIGSLVLKVFGKQRSQQSRPRKQGLNELRSRWKVIWTCLERNPQKGGQLMHLRANTECTVRLKRVFIELVPVFDL
jgi:hypothetical protein